MNEPLDPLELASLYARGAASAEETRQLEEALRLDPDLRTRYIRYLNLDPAIAAAVNAGAFGAVKPDSGPGPKAGGFPRVKHHRRQLTGALVCLTAFLAGVAGTSLVWALGPGQPHSTSRVLPGLADGGFDVRPGPIRRGFPTSPGYWSGDESEITNDPPDSGEGGLLRFIQPGVDKTRPNGPAVSCDVFQLINLADLWDHQDGDTEAVLELSANFRDSRPVRGQKILFLCQVFLFAEEPGEIARNWPLNIPQAVGSAATLVNSAGGEPNQWLPARTKCILSPAARFAVVQIGAKRPSPASALGLQYADRVALSLRTQPNLPGRISP